jgi:hypothetical protein
MEQTTPERELVGLAMRTSRPRINQGGVMSARTVVHLKRMWADDAALCGRIGGNSEAVLSPDLVTCKRCLKILAAQETRPDSK